MKNLKKLITYVFIALSVAIISCSPEDGKDGAQGPQGEQGTAGQDGQDGQDGNANVIASDWIATNFSVNATSFTSFDVNDANINEENANNGLVLAFGRVDENTVISIPFTFSNRSYYIAMFIAQNNIRFLGAVADGTGSEIFNDFSEVRYIIIPPAPGFTGGTSSSEKILANLDNQGIDITNYKEVADHFNLKN